MFSYSSRALSPRLQNINAMYDEKSLKEDATPSHSVLCCRRYCSLNNREGFVVVVHRLLWMSTDVFCWRAPAILPAAESVSDCSPWALSKAKFSFCSTSSKLISIELFLIVTDNDSKRLMGMFYATAFSLNERLCLGGKFCMIVVSYWRLTRERRTSHQCG